MVTTYQQARSLICDGDTVAIITPHNWIGKVTQFFTRRKYTHTGIAIWIDDGLYLAELNGGGNHLTPLSHWDGLDFDVCEMPIGLIDIRGAIFEMLRAPIEYSYAGFLAAGARAFFNIQQAIHWRNKLVCDGFCVAVYERAGWTKHDRVIAPFELVDELRIKIEVRG
jgi:hypothetical protein